MPHTGSRSAVAVETDFGIPSVTRPEERGLSMYCWGFDLNFSRQWAQQKYNFLPSCSWTCFEVAGFTFIPQTGSRSTAVVGSGALISFEGAPFGSPTMRFDTDALYWIHPAQYRRQFNILQKGFGE